jgi:hypothetical protein
LNTTVEMSSSTWANTHFWRAYWLFYVYFDWHARDGSYYCFFWKCCCHQGGSVTSFVGVLAARGDVLTQQQ